MHIVFSYFQGRIEFSEVEFKDAETKFETTESWTYITRDIDGMKTLFYPVWIVKQIEYYKKESAFRDSVFG